MKIAFCRIIPFDRKLFHLFLFVQMCCSFAVCGYAETYRLVRNEGELIAGERYLVVGTDGLKWYALGYQKTGNRQAAPVTIADDAITATVASSSKDQVSPYVLVLEGAVGAWALKDEVNGKYLCPDKSENKLIGNSSLVRWKIGLKSSFTGEASLECVESSYIGKASPKYIRYSTNALFSCYSNELTQTPVYLFKVVKEESTVVPPPSFSLSGGSYMGAQTLSLISSEGTAVYYTTNGVEPSEASTPYEHPFLITASMTVKAVAYDIQGNSSNVVTQTYLILENTNVPQAYKKIFFEGFDANRGEGGGDGQWSGMTWTQYEETHTDIAGWTFRSKGFAAFRCLLLGTHGEAGEKASATTPILGISGKALLRFKAGAWDTGNEKDQLTLKLMDGGIFENNTSVYTVTLKKGMFKVYEVPVFEMTEQTKISFVSAETTTSSDARFFLDEVGLFIPIAAEKVQDGVDALGGKWSVADLADILDFSVSDPERPFLELDVTSVSYLWSDFVIDNQGGTPNLLVHSREPLTVVNALNVVNHTFQAPVRLTDLNPFYSSQKIGGVVNLVRPFTGVDANAGGWQVICLPFTVKSVQGNGAEYISYAEWIKTKPKDKGFFWLKTVDVSTPKNDIDADALLIEANKPYIIAFPNYGYADYPLLNIAVPTEFQFSGDGVESTENLQSLSMKNWRFQPSYLAYTHENCYVLNVSGDRFERASVKEVMTSDPFRPYLMCKEINGTSVSSVFVIGEDNGPVSVGKIRADSGKELSVFTREGELWICSFFVDNLSVYTLQGELVTSVKLVEGENRFPLLAGIYIVNRQKVIVK